MFQSKTILIIIRQSYKDISNPYNFPHITSNSLYQFNPKIVV